MDRSTAIEIALIKDKTTPAQRLLAREFLETEFALQMATNFLNIDLKIPPQQVRQYMLAYPEVIWNQATLTIKHKYPKLYWDDAKCDKQEADLLRDELNGK